MNNILISIIIIIILVFVYKNTKKNIENYTNNNCKEKIYGIGTNKYMYITNLNGGDWKIVDKSCCVTNIYIYNDYIYGIGTSKALWKKDMNGGKWSKISDGYVTQIFIYNDTSTTNIFFSLIWYKIRFVFLCILFIIFIRLIIPI